MKFLLKLRLYFFVLLFLSFSVLGQTVADIKNEVFVQLVEDGYLSSKMAQEAQSKYITVEDKAVVLGVTNDKSATWSEYLSWINFIKVVAIILLVVAFSGFIKAFIRGIWRVVSLVPLFVYQILFLSLSIFATFWPHLVWETQAFYVALFCSMINLVIVSSIVMTYKQVVHWFRNIFVLKLDEKVVISFCLMLYFLLLTFMYESSVFGFFSVIALSGVFSFSIIYVPGVVYLGFKESALNILIFSHIIVLAIYVLLSINNSGYISLFSMGFEYYASIALGLALLVGASPFYKKHNVLYMLVFCVIVALAYVLYFFLSMTALATVLFIFFGLVFVEWIIYMGFKSNWIIGCTFVGMLLYSLALLMERYGVVVLQNLKVVLN